MTEIDSEVDMALVFAEMEAPAVTCDVTNDAPARIALSCIIGSRLTLLEKWDLEWESETAIDRNTANAARKKKADVKFIFNVACKLNAQRIANIAQRTILSITPVPLCHRMDVVCWDILIGSDADKV